jgi:hypothetical protein
MVFSPILILKAYSMPLIFVSLKGKLFRRLYLSAAMANFYAIYVCQLQWQTFSPFMSVSCNGKLFRRSCYVNCKGKTLCRLNQRNAKAYSQIPK